MATENNADQWAKSLADELNRRRKTREEENRRKGRLNAAGYVLGVIIGLLVLPLLVKVSWNHTIHRIAGVQEITYLDAVCLYLITNTLFGGIWPRGRVQSG